MVKKTPEYKVIFYYFDKMEAKYVYDDDDNNELHSISILELNKPENKFHGFRILGQDYENNYKSLIKYKNDFNREHNELRTEWLVHGISKKRYKFNYKKYYNHNNAVYHYFLSQINRSILEDFENTTEDEFYIFSKCYNAGLITLNLDYKNKEVQCFGADYTKYYPHLLLDIKIPQKSGVKHNLENIELGKLKFGIYRVKITYKDNKFTNIFNFSKHHHYNSTTLNYLFKIKNDFGLEFELLKINDEYDYNALLYDEKYLINGDKIFKIWFNSFKILLEKYPKNKLLKHLMSSLWGSITSYKNVYFSNSEDADMDHLDSTEKSEYRIKEITDNGDYKCVKSADAYNYSLARIKPFLVAHGRLKILKLIIENNLINNLVRVHTDGIVLNKFVDFSKFKSAYYPKPEDKTTGLMVYENSMRGFHICLKCKNKFDYKDFKDHKNCNP